MAWLLVDNDSKLKSNPFSAWLQQEKLKFRWLENIIFALSINNKSNFFVLLIFCMHSHLFCMLRFVFFVPSCRLCTNAKAYPGNTSMYNLILLKSRLDVQVSLGLILAMFVIVEKWKVITISLINFYIIIKKVKTASLVI